MGLFKSTRYRHFYTQGVSLVNSNYMYDPINTYAAAGLARGKGAGESVIEGIRKGSGLKLKQYYQYSTIRYKNRNFKAFYGKVKFSNTNGLKPHIKLFRNFVPENSQLNDLTTKFSVDGVYHYAYMQKEFGLDTFNTKHNDYSINLSRLQNLDTISTNSSGKSWIVGYLDSEGVSQENLTPVVILHPLDANNPDLSTSISNIFILDIREYIPKESIGISYFTSDIEPKVTIKEDTEEREGRLSVFKERYSDISIGSKLLVSTSSDWQVDFDEKSGTSLEPIGDNLVLENNDTETITKKYIKVINIVPVEDTLVYREIIETTEITYNKEDFVYAFPEENSPLAVKINLINKVFNEVGGKTPTDLFKFYPYIPVREIDNLWGGSVESTLDYSNTKILELTSKFTRDQRHILGLPNESASFNKVSKNKLIKSLHMSTATGGLINLDGKFDAKGLAGNAGSNSEVHDALIKYNKEKENNKKSFEEWYAQKEREASLDDLESDTPNQRKQKKADKKTNRLESYRDLNRETARTRKVKFRSSRNPIKKLSNNAVKRHLEHMGDLLGLELHKTVPSIVTARDAHKLKRIYLMPAVNLNTHHNDVVKYWWTFFNRLYNKLGDGGLTEWEANVLSSDSLAGVNLNMVTWENVANTFTGMLGFAFIQKFEIEGTIRTIKHKRDVYEIRRGKPLTISSIEDLKTNITPLKQLADDKYYTSFQGKQWNIGGESSFKGEGANYYNPVSLVLGNYNYTFICKQIGKNKLSVIAVAGLVGRTDVGYSRAYWGAAWYDLGLEYQRNRDKYINSTNEAVLYTNEYRESKKHYQQNQISTFFHMPIDYNTIRRMGGIDLERFSQRAVTIYTWTTNEVKFKAKWVGTAIKVVGYIVAAIVAIYDWSGSSSSAIIAATSAIAKAIVTAIITQLVVKTIIVPLMKALGIKGLIALIILIIIAIVASYASGYNPKVSSLPYASQSAVTNTASQATVQATSQATTGTVFETAKEAIISTVADSLNVTLRQGLSTALSAANESVQTLYQKEQSNVQAEIQAHNREHMENMKELEEKQEEFQNRNASYDSILVLKSLVENFKVQHPTTFYGQLLDVNDIPATYQYLESFLSMKLNLTPENFDSIGSLDFSLPLNV